MGRKRPSGQTVCQPKDFSRKSLNTFCPQTWGIHYCLPPFPPPPLPQWSGGWPLAPIGPSPAPPLPMATMTDDYDSVHFYLCCLIVQYPTIPCEDDNDDNAGQDVDAPSQSWYNGSHWAPNNGSHLANNGFQSCPPWLTLSPQWLPSSQQRLSSSRQPLSSSGHQPIDTKTRLLEHSQKIWHKMTSNIIAATCVVSNLSKQPKWGNVT